MRGMWTVRHALRLLKETPYERENTRRVAVRAEMDRGRLARRGQPLCLHVVQAYLGGAIFSEGVEILPRLRDRMVRGDNAPVPMRERGPAEGLRSEQGEMLPLRGREPMTEKLLHELDEAERKAWDALSRYKFWMFGYWAAIWVHLHRISGEKRPSPFKALVKMAREKTTP